MRGYALLRYSYETIMYSLVFTMISEIYKKKHVGQFFLSDALFANRLQEILLYVVIHY